MEFSNYDIANMFVKSNTRIPVQRLRQAYCVALCIDDPVQRAWNWREAEFLRFQATGRQHRGCIIPQAVNTVYCS
jgi:hypothetical protein